VNPSVNRRHFLLSSLAVGTTAIPGCALPLVHGKKLRHAAIAVGGMGASDLGQIASHPNVVITALCDIDSGRLAEAHKSYPGARIYQDWRKLLRLERGRLDSVHVSCPDHMHAPIAMEALRQGLHVYCQKPLTHTVVEARRLTEMAQKSNLVTQMGIQNHSGKNYRQALKVFQTGITGPVHTAHVWTDRPAGWWPQDVERSENTDEVPQELDWNGWLGVAPKRPFVKGAYHAFAWRGRLDFGTGAQGDMACHLMDPVPWFLGVRHPLHVTSAGPKPNQESYPEWSQVSYHFGATSRTSKEGVNVTWHDGGRKPEELLRQFGFTEKVYANACLFIGEKGAFLTSPYEPCIFSPHQGTPATPTLPEVPDVNHWHEFVQACLQEGKTSASFDYSGPLTEIALLGNVALHFPNQKLLWNAKDLKFHNNTDADAYLHKPYRKGWEVRGL
jgi:predicted dehydrogenase